MRLNRRLSLGVKKCLNLVKKFQEGKLSRPRKKRKALSTADITQTRTIDEMFNQLKK
jgi:hypothetical protein